MSSTNENPERKATKDSLEAHRVGANQYEAQNDRGAKILIGPQKGAFTPVELLKLSLATCNSLSAEEVLKTALGADFEAKVGIATLASEAGDRHEKFEVDVIADLSGLSEDAAATLEKEVQAAISKRCTVGHTLNHSVVYDSRLLSTADETALQSEGAAS